VLRASPYDREIAALAFPALATLVAEPLYVLADTAVVGRLGTIELAGLAVASSVLLLINAVFVFLAYGTTGTVARLIGAGRPRDALEHTVASVWVAAGAGTVVAALLFVLAPDVLSLLGAEGGVAEQGLIYLRVSLPGVPFLLINLAAVGYLRGMQDTRTPLVITAVSASANLVIELALIFGLGYGIGASALATVLAQTGAAAAYLRPIVREARGQSVALRPHGTAALVLARDGVALVVRTTALRGALVLATAAAARMGTAEVAAHQVAYEIWALAALTLDAVAIAGQALTGHHLGAGVVEKARGAAGRMIQIDIAVGVIIGVLLLAGSQVLPRIFTTDEAVLDLAAFLLIWVAIQQPLNGLVFAIDGILIGAGDLSWLAGAMVISALLFGVAAWAIIQNELGLGWLWAAITAFLATRAIALVVRFRSGAWLVTGA
jgi:putative MATE family efflux protein